MTDTPRRTIETNVFTVPFQRPLPLRSSTRPLYAIIREVDYRREGTDDELWFYYSRWSDNVDVPSVNRLEELINDVADRDYRWDHQSPSYPDPTKPFTSLLSLKNTQVSYVIFKLSDKPWQFCGRGRPITVGRKGMQKEAYFEGHRVFSGWNEKDTGTPFDDPDPPKNGSKVAYFIADAEKAGRNEPRNEYSHPMNLHVDLRQTVNGDKYYMPIIIDPDVRYPGGSG